MSGCVRMLRYMTIQPLWQSKLLMKGSPTYEMMADITQGLINLFAAGLYHLFEQQLNYIYLHTIGRHKAKRTLAVRVTAVSR
jgi:hypothetical protein